MVMAGNLRTTSRDSGKVFEVVRQDAVHIGRCVATFASPREGLDRFTLIAVQHAATPRSF